MNRLNIYSITISYDRNSATQMCLKAKIQRVIKQTEHKTIGHLFTRTSLPIIYKLHVHRKKAFRYSRPRPGCHLPFSP
jgi:hypothetical protein